MNADRAKERSKKYYNDNKDEINKNLRIKYLNNENNVKEERLVYQRNYHIKNRKEILIKNKIRYNKNKKQIRANQKDYYNKNKKKILENHKIYHSKKYPLAKLQVLNYYSKGMIRCACCGENNIKFLTIDHINNEGHKHRKEIKGQILIYWLIKNNLPEGFQILCYNCNCAKPHNNNICPHKEARTILPISVEWSSH